MDKPIIAGIIVAGGQGKRMAASVPKQFIKLDHIPVLVRSLLPFEQSGRIKNLVVVLSKKWHSRGLQLAKKYGIQKIISFAPAGRTRQLSVHHGLLALEQIQPDLVVIHDAARPLVTKKLIERICSAAKTSGAASAALPIHDTVVHKQHGKLIDRNEVLRIQTPQAFHFLPLLKAHEKSFSKRMWNYPDDASLLRAYGIKTTFVQGEVTNIKITTKEDIKSALAIIKDRA